MHKLHIQYFSELTRSHNDANTSLFCFKSIFDIIPIRMDMPNNHSYVNTVSRRSRRYKMSLFLVTCYYDLDGSGTRQAELMD